MRGCTPSSARRAAPTQRRLTAPVFAAWAFVAAVGGAGCEQLVRQADRDVAALIRERQRQALEITSSADAGTPERWRGAGRAAYERSPRPTDQSIPDAFRRPRASATQPSAGIERDANALTRPAEVATTGPATARTEPFTLLDALAYAQQHQREYMTAKEQLYLAALALTLERHLWTPIFASQFQTVYGNYGEARQFDQAMRFVSDWSVRQRLPYGGEVTGRAISTLIRDVKKSLTAEESSRIEAGVRIPLLRGAGHVAREDLIRLERELTYSVRVFERFRRQLLVRVAQAYFGLLERKQNVANNAARYERAIDDFRRAQALQEAGKGSLLDTQRAEQAMLSAENFLLQAAEDFRSEADQFKLLIGMPVEEPLRREDIEDIAAIERAIIAGAYPLLTVPEAVGDFDLAIGVALDRRLDLLTLRDRIDDARRGVDISRNALLPDLNWEGNVTLPTDPNRYSLTHFHTENANWRTQITLELPLERTAERNRLRRALIDVRAAQRDEQDQGERIRTEVRRVVNLLQLADKRLAIAEQQLKVAERRAEFASLQFEEGLISNRDKVEAEQELLDAQLSLNSAKTARWGLILQFRLATETLLIDEDGRPLDT